jgi:hypothetical protein
MDDAKHCCKEFEMEVYIEVMIKNDDGTYCVWDQSSCTALDNVRFCPFCGAPVT